MGGPSNVPRSKTRRKAKSGKADRLASSAPCKPPNTRQRHPLDSSRQDDWLPLKIPIHLLYQRDLPLQPLDLPDAQKAGKDRYEDEHDRRRTEKVGAVLG
jgi:hypothetical protein